MKLQYVSPLFCEKGTTHKTNFTGEAKKQTRFKETFLFIPNELIEVSK
jgi:hypothetical protein